VADPTARLIDAPAELGEPQNRGVVTAPTSDLFAHLNHVLAVHEPLPVGMAVRRLLPTAGEVVM